MIRNLLRVRCILCGKIFECDRNNTLPLIDHIKNNHPEITVTHSVGGTSHYIIPPKIIQTADIGWSGKKLLKFSSKSGRRFSDSEIIKRIPDEKNLKNTEKYTKSENHKESKEMGYPKVTKSLENIGVAPLEKTFEKDYLDNMNVLEKSPEEAKIIYKRKYEYKKSSVAHRGGRRRLYRTSIENWRPGKSTIVCPVCGANERPIIKTLVNKESRSRCGAACILTCWPFCFLPWLFPPPTKEYLHCSVCHNFLGCYDHKTDELNPNVEYLKRRPTHELQSNPLKVDDEICSM